MAHERKRILVNDMKQTFGEAIDNMSGYSAKYMRSWGKEMESFIKSPKIQKVLGTEAQESALKEVKDKVRQHLQKKFPNFKMGKIPITGKDGKTRNYDPDKWSWMTARTRTRDLRESGLHQEMIQSGLDLVVVSIGGSGDACKNWEGKVLSITGETKGYPTVQEARASGEIWHPNCVHSTSPFIAYAEEDTGEIGVLGRDLDDWKELDKNFSKQIQKMEKEFAKYAVCMKGSPAFCKTKFKHQEYWEDDFEEKMDEIVKMVGGKPSDLSLEEQIAKFLKEGKIPFWSVAEEKYILLPAKGVIEEVYEGGVKQWTKDFRKFAKDFKESPIVVRIPLGKSKVRNGLSRDGRAKNLFEAEKGYGKADKVTRHSWEDYMLHGKVNREFAEDGRLFLDGKSLSVKERPIYGMSGFPDALKEGLGNQYGGSYFVLKENVKNRSTFSFGDSISKQGSFTKDNLFSSFSKDSVNLQYMNYVNSRLEFLESQIWGGVSLKDDVASLVLHPDDLFFTATPTLDPAKIKRIVEMTKKYGFELKITPGWDSVLKYNPNMASTKDILSFIKGDVDKQYEFKSLSVLTKTKSKQDIITAYLEKQKVYAQFGLKISEADTAIYNKVRKEGVKEVAKTIPSTAKKGSRIASGTWTPKEGPTKKWTIYDGLLKGKPDEDIIGEVMEKFGESESKVRSYFKGKLLEFKFKGLIISPHSL